MAYSGKFKDIAHLIEQSLEDKVYLQKQLLCCKVYYMEGKYLNKHSKFEKEEFADVEFEENTYYKTWWYSNDNSWEPDPDILVYVEESSPTEEMSYKKQISDIDKQIDNLMNKRAEIKRLQKTAKPNILNILKK